MPFSCRLSRYISICTRNHVVLVMHLCNHYHTTTCSPNLALRYPCTRYGIVQPSNGPILVPIYHGRASTPGTKKWARSRGNVSFLEGLYPSPRLFLLLSTTVFGCHTAIPWGYIVALAADLSDRSRYFHRQPGQAMQPCMFCIWPFHSAGRSPGLR